MLSPPDTAIWSIISSIGEHVHQFQLPIVLALVILVGVEWQFKTVEVDMDQPFNFNPILCITTELHRERENPLCTWRVFHNSPMLEGLCRPWQSLSTRLSLKLRSEQDSSVVSIYSLAPCIIHHAIGSTWLALHVLLPTVYEALAMTSVVCIVLLIY